MIRIALITTVVGACCMFASVSIAQSRRAYDLTWQTVDGGGETVCSGGTYTLGGTVGQPDAAIVTGGTYALAGGFWTAETLTAACTSDADCGVDVCWDRCEPGNPGANPAGCVHEYQVRYFGDIVHWFAWEPGAPQQPDLDDILCIIDGFAAGANWPDVCPDGDIKITSPPGCGGDAQINLDDIIAVLDAFAGNPACQDQCP